MHRTHIKDGRQLHAIPYNVTQWGCNRVRVSRGVMKFVSAKYERCHVGEGEGVNNNHITYINILSTPMISSSVGASIASAPAICGDSAWH